MNARRAVLVTVMACCVAATGRAAELETLVIASHTSDPTRHGPTDIQMNYLGIGATLTAPRVGLELDMTIGRKQDVHVWGCDANNYKPCGPQWAGQLEMRWHPGRMR